MATTLTPELAQDLMWRSMTTGVPTNELTQYGGYDAVKALYDQIGGQYSRDVIPADRLQQLANQVAQTGVGEMSLLGRATVPLSQAALNSVAEMQRLTGMTNAELAARGIPVTGALNTVANPPVVPGVVPANTPAAATNYTQPALGRGAELSAPAYAAPVRLPTVAARPLLGVGALSRLARVEQPVAAPTPINVSRSPTALLPNEPVEFGSGAYTPLQEQLLRAYRPLQYGSPLESLVG